MNITHAFKRHLASRALSGLLAGALTLATPFGTMAQPVGLPSMGSASAADFSPQLERTLGEAIMQQGRHDPTYVADPDVNQYLTEMGQRLANNAPGGVGQPITVFAVKDPQINAFALPGGYIGINSGLLVSAQTESELASVIAHEIGHVAQRHIARGMTQRSQSSAVMWASMAGALLAALAGSGDLAMGVAAFGQAAAVDRQLGFSRQAEQEADRAGLEMMRKAGFDPSGAVRMFQHLSAASRLNEGTGGGAYASTHPMSIQRMSDMQNRVASLPSRAVASSPDFWYIRAKLRVLQASGGQAMQTAQGALKSETRSGQTALVRSAAWYGLAYAAWKARNYDEAANYLRQARQNVPAAAQLDALAISMALDQKAVDQALQLSVAAWQRWPDHQAIALLHAQALQQAGHDDQAVAFLKKCVKNWPAFPDLYQLQAYSLERLGQPVSARRQMAHYYELTGALPTAVEQLNQARGLTNDFYLQSELDMQIRTLRDKLRADRELLENFKS
jgi:predicted Zn-dependent protease